MTEASTNLYTLPALPFAYDALEPWCSAETLEIHHDKHHGTYVKEANAAAAELATVDPHDTPRLAGLQSSLTFNLAGHVMHSLFWASLDPSGGFRGHPRMMACAGKRTAPWPLRPGMGRTARRSLPCR